MYKLVWFVFTGFISFLSTALKGLERNFKYSFTENKIKI